MHYSGIAMGNSFGYGVTLNTDILVTDNHVHHIGGGVLSDMACIYNYGRAAGMLVAGNVCHDVEAAGYGGWGLYLDEGTSETVWRDNVVYRTESAGIHQHYGVGESGASLV